MPLKFSWVLACLLAAACSSGQLRYAVPAGSLIDSVPGPSSVRLLIDARLADGVVTVALEIINDGPSELLVQPERFEVRDAEGIVVPFNFLEKTPVCDGKPRENVSVLGFRELCRIQIDLRPTRPEKLTVVHHGIARDGRDVPLSVELREKAE